MSMVPPTQTTVSIPATDIVIEKTSFRLAQIRELVQGGITIVLLIGTVILFVASFIIIGNVAAFDQVKELLLVLMPLVGVILGYYFGKAGPESRAERAEEMVQRAFSNIGEAFSARVAAEKKVKEGEERLQNVLSLLNELRPIAEQFVKQTEAGLGKISSDDDAHFDALRREMQTALIHVSRVLDKQSNS